MSEQPPTIEYSHDVTHFPEAEHDPKLMFEQLQEEYFALMEKAKEPFEDAYHAKVKNYENQQTTEITKRLFQEAWDNERFHRLEIESVKRKIEDFSQEQPDIKMQADAELEHSLAQIQHLYDAHHYVKFGILPSREVDTEHYQIGNLPQLTEIDTHLQELEINKAVQTYRLEKYLENPTAKAEKYHS